MSEPDVDAMKDEESNEFDAMDAKISPTVLNVEPGAPGGVSEPAVTTDARNNTDMNADAVGRETKYENQCFSRGFASPSLNFLKIPSMVILDAHVLGYPSTLHILRMP